MSSVSASLSGVVLSCELFDADLTRRAPVKLLVSPTIQRSPFLLVAVSQNVKVMPLNRMLTLFIRIWF